MVSKAGNLDYSGVPRSDLDLVNAYFDRVLMVDESEELQYSQVLVTTIVDNLYRSALAQATPANNNCWFNWIGFMTAKVACRIWRKIPSSQQSPELFERLVTPTLTVQELLTGFDPQYQPDLLVGLQGWTYQVVKYHLYTNLRKNGHPYLGLSNLGIVARSSYKQMRLALAGSIAPNQLELDISICKVFKNYLQRSKVSANELEPDDWQEILGAVRSIGINVTVEELGGQIDRVGSLIRAHASPVIQSYDDQFLSIEADRYASLSPPDLDELAPVFGQIFTIIDRFIHDLPGEARKIVELYHPQHLNQKSIGIIIAQDRIELAASRDSQSRPWVELSPAEIEKIANNYQTKVSLKLGKIYKSLLDNIHTKISHPDGKVGQRNSLAIQSVKQLLDQYFRQANHSKST